jgi:hypothetical protein
MPVTNTNTGDAQNQSLSAHQVAAIRENINHYSDRSRNLAATVDADLNFMKPGTSYSSNSYSDVSFKPVAKANRFNDHERDRVKRGKRQANFTDHELVLVESSFTPFEEMVDPMNALNRKAGEAHSYFQDEFIMQTMFADMLEAVDDVADADKFNLGHKMQVVTFPAANIIGVDYAGYHDGKSDGKAAPTNADQGLTKSKLLGSREVLAKRRTRSRGLTVACTETDILNLATSLQLTSQDFVNPKLLMDIERLMAQESEMFLSMKFKVLFPDVQTGNGTNAAEVGIYDGDAIEYREREIVSLRHDILTTEHMNHQLYASLQATCLRNDDTSVCKVLVNHTNTPVT